MSIATMEMKNSGHDLAYVSSIYKFCATDRTGALSSSSTTSSIGKNSDVSLVGGDEEEVQSEYKGGPLDSLDALEEVLPVNLSDAASCPSIEDIRKPENAYTRKRNNLLAFTSFWDKNQGIVSRGSSHGISKRPTNSRSMLYLRATTNSSESNSGETSNSNSSSPGCCLPPLPPQARMALQNEQSSCPSYNGLWMNRSNE